MWGEYGFMYQFKYKKKWTVSQVMLWHGSDAS